VEAVEHRLALRQWLKKNRFLIVAATLVALGGFLVGILPLQTTLLLAVFLIGLLLAAMAMISRRTRSTAVVLMLVVLPLTSILKAVTGSRFAPLAFDLGLLLACGLHLLDGLVQGKLRFGKLDMLLLVLWGLAFVQLFNPNVPSMQAGIEGFRKFIFMSIAFYMSRHLLQIRDFRLLVKGMILFAIPVTLYGIKQFFVMWPIDYRMIALSTSSSITFLMGGWIRPFSTMSGPFQLGSYLMILLLLILALLKGKIRHPTLRLLLIGLFMLQIILLLMTRTKGNWGGFIVGVIVLFVLQSHNPVRALVRLGGFALIGGAIIFLVFSLTSGSTFTVLDDAFFAITHPLQAPTFIFRMDLWQETIIPAIQRQLFWGYGTSSAGEGLSNLYEGTRSRYFFSHNLYFKILLEMGILGLAMFLWIVGESLWKGLRQLYKPTNINPDATILLQWSVACVVAFLVSGFVIPNLDAYPPNYYFWLLLGLLSNAATLRTQS
jgi:hypothetical protein